MNDHQSSATKITQEIREAIGDATRRLRAAEAAATTCLALATTDDQRTAVECARRCVVEAHERLSLAHRLWSLCDNVPRDGQQVVYAAESVFYAIQDVWYCLRDVHPANQRRAWSADRQRGAN